MNFLRLTLLATAALLLLAGAMLFVVQPAIGGEPGPSPATASANLVVVSHEPDTALIATIVSHDIFAATRSAPPSTFAPANARPPGGAATQARRGPELIGTVADGASGSALIRFSPGTEPRLLRIGERAGEWRLVGVDARSATLAGPGGTRTISMRAGGVTP